MGHAQDSERQYANDTLMMWKPGWPLAVQSGASYRFQLASRYARLRLRGWVGATYAGLFFVALTASRFFFSASVRFTTLRGASAVDATISSPAICSVELGGVSHERRRFPQDC
jgi:hypothetical protein